MANDSGGGGESSSDWDSSTVVDNTVSAFQALNSSIDAWGDTLGNIWTSITSGFQSIGNGISGLFTAVSDGFQIMGNFFSGFWNSLCGLFVPSEDFWNDSLFDGIENAFANKFQFLDGFRTAFGAMANTHGETLNYQFTVDLGFGQHTYNLDFSWYENHRLTIRSAIGSLFMVSGILIALRNILRAFGVELNQSYKGEVSEKL